MDHNNHDDYVYSSSSADSIASGEDSFTEEVIEHDGRNELILVPRREVRQKLGDL